MLVRELSIITYLSTHSVECILEKKINQIYSYSYVLHDKDTYSEDTYSADNRLLGVKGELKQPHIHIYIKLKRSREDEEIANWFAKSLDKSESSNVRFELVGNRDKLLRYFTHEDYPEKAQYDKSCVINYNIVDITNSDECIDSSYLIINDILSGMPLLELIRIYGREFVYHYTNYNQLAKDIKHEQQKIEIDSYIKEQNRFKKQIDIGDLKVIDEDLPF